MISIVKRESCLLLSNSAQALLGHLLSVIELNRAHLLVAHQVLTTQVIANFLQETTKKVVTFRNVNKNKLKLKDSKNIPDNFDTYFLRLFLLCVGINDHCRFMFEYCIRELCCTIRMCDVILVCISLCVFSVLV